MIKLSFVLIIFLIAGICQAAEIGKLFFKETSGPDSVYTDFAVADFNNDSLPDIAVGNWSEKNKTGSVYIYINKGGGSFEKAFSFACSNTPAALIAGDFDADGLTDLAYAEQKWLLNVRTGKDKFQECFRDMNQSQWIPSLTVGKLQKKGKIDFLCGPVWRLWNSDNSFTRGHFSVKKGEKLNANSLIADTDKDGNSDVVFFENYIRILYGPIPENANMKMENSMATYFVELPSSFKILSLALEDMDGDGITDIAAIGNDKAHKGIWIYKQHLHGFDPAEKPVRVFPDACQAFCIGDDLMAYSDGKKIHLILKDRMKGFMSAGPENFDALPFANAKKMQITDIDGDKSPELILLSPTELLILKLAQTLKKD